VTLLMHWADGGCDARSRNKFTTTVVPSWVTCPECRVHLRDYLVADWRWVSAYPHASGALHLPDCHARCSPPGTSGIPPRSRRHTTQAGLRARLRVHESGARGRSLSSSPPSSPSVAAGRRRFSRADGRNGDRPRGADPLLLPQDDDVGHRPSFTDSPSAGPLPPRTNPDEPSTRHAHESRTAPAHPPAALTARRGRG
jgi:hypothetical protein